LSRRIRCIVQDVLSARISPLLENFLAYRGDTTRRFALETQKQLPESHGDSSISHGDRSRIAIIPIRVILTLIKVGAVLIRRVLARDLAASLSTRVSNLANGERDLSRLLTSAMRTFLISYSIINPLVISDYFRHASEMTSCHRLV